MEALMHNASTLIAFLAGLSVATERVVEVIKGLPGISAFLTVDRAGTAEEARKATVQLVAIVVGSILAAMTYGQLPAQATLPHGGWQVYTLFGVMASGGSGLWNSALDIVRETNTQKQLITEKLKAGA